MGPMIFLVISYCLASAPSQCADERLVFNDVSLMQCFTGSQMQAAAWAEQHPGRTVKRVRCALPDKEGEPA